MKCIKSLIISGVLLLLLLPARSQMVLGKDEAVAMVIAQNFNVRIAGNDVLLAQNNTDKGAIGYNPIVNASANGTVDYGNAFQEFATGDEITSKNLTTAATNASVNVLWDVCAGGSRDLTYERMIETVKLTEMSKRATIEAAVLELLVGYYDVANLTKTVEALGQTLEVTSQRLQRARYSFEYGQGNRLQILNAEVDLNRDSINLRDAEQQLANAKRNVNVMLARDVNTSFAVDTTVAYDATLTMEAIRSEAMDSNVSVMMARKNLDILDYDVGLNESTRYPTITLNGSLSGNLSRNLTGNSFINSSKGWGPQVGVSVGWNIYDGGLRRVNRDNIRIQQKSQQVFIDQVRQELDRDVNNAWEVYQNALYNLEIEEHNLVTNQSNFSRTKEQFNIGQVSSVEFRQAQFNLVSAEINLSTARYTAKVAELRLLQLGGLILDAKY